MLDAEKFLSEIEPFNQLDKGEIQSIAQSLIVEYYKKGEILFKEGSTPLEFLYILRKGSLLLEKDEEVIEYLHEGECFGYIYLMTSEPPSSTAKALEDSVVFLLNKKIFNKLISNNEAFREYFSRKLAKRIQLAEKKEFKHGIEKYTNISLVSINPRPLLVLDGEKTVEDAIKEMVAMDSTYLLVSMQKGFGIITERDVLKKVLAKGLSPSEVKLESIASFPLISIESNSTLYDAMYLMSKYAIRKLLLVKDGKPIGVIEDRDLIAYESKNAVLLIKEIDKAKSVEDLKYLYKLVKEQVLDLVFQGTDPERLSEYISEINDRFMKKAVYITINRLGEEPSVPFSIVVLGSEGRREQSLKTDQDNALIYQEDPILEFDARQYFDRFSKVYINTLLEIGFPPCPGNVMVSNSFWRKSLKEWQQAVRNWIEKPKSENILNIAIFFDFRNVFGDQRLSEDLWNSILKSLKENPGFLPFLAVDAVRSRPPLGFFKEFIVEKTGEHRGELDIKKGGIFPITQGIRALALEGRISERSTFDRIRALRSLGILTNELAKDLEEAYRYLLSLRFRSQAKKMTKGKKPDNYINLQELSRTEKNTLKDVFKIIKEFQDFLYDRYNLRFFE